MSDPAIFSDRSENSYLRCFEQKKSHSTPQKQNIVLWFFWVFFLDFFGFFWVFMGFLVFLGFFVWDPGFLHHWGWGGRGGLFNCIHELVDVE